MSRPANSKQTAAAKISAPQVEEAASLPHDRNSTLTDTATSLTPEQNGEPGVNYHVSGSDPSNVERKSVKTTGDFSLKDPMTGTDIPMGEVAKDIVVTSFIRERLENGDLEEA